MKSSHARFLACHLEKISELLPPSTPAQVPASNAPTVAIPKRPLWIQLMDWVTAHSTERPKANFKQMEQEALDS